MYTIQDLASELNLSRQGIEKRVNSLGLKPKRLGKRLIVLSEGEAKRVRQAKNKPGPEPTSASGRGRNGHKRAKNNSQK